MYKMFLAHGPPKIIRTNVGWVWSSFLLVTEIVWIFFWRKMPLSGDWETGTETDGDRTRDTNSRHSPQCCANWITRQNATIKPHCHYADYRNATTYQVSSYKRRDMCIVLAGICVYDVHVCCVRVARTFGLLCHHGDEGEWYMCAVRSVCVHFVHRTIIV